MRLVRVSCLLLSFLLAVLATPVEAQPVNSAEDHNELARAYYRTASFLLAAEEFRKAYDLDKDPARLFNAGLAFEKAEKFEEAHSAFTEYLKVAPKGERAAEARARQEAMNREIAGHAKTADAEELRRETDVLADQARVLQAEGKHAEAAEVFQSAFDSSKDKQYLFKRADALRFAKRTQEAIAGYQDYRNSDPKGIFVGEARRRQEELESQLGGGLPTVEFRGQTDASSGLRTTGYISGGLGFSAMMFSFVVLLETKDNRETDLLQAFSEVPPRQVSAGDLDEFRSSFRTQIIVASVGIQGISAGTACLTASLFGVETRATTIAPCLLIGQGLAALALGTLALTGDGTRREMADANPTGQELTYFQNKLDDESSMQTAHYVLGGTGLALGTLIYVLGRRSLDEESEQKRTMTFGPNFSSGGPGWVGSFRF